MNRRNGWPTSRLLNANPTLARSDGVGLQIYETRVRPGAIRHYCMLPSSASAPTLNAAPSLEELAYYYGTDKSHDDHKYTDCYAALFDPIRTSARNVTEIGIANGQSLQVWHDYFAHAHIWGFDVVRDKVRAAKQLFSGAPRMHLFASSSTSARAMHNTGLAMGSMDVVIDDGDHYAGSMDKTLQVVWPYLRAGGYYIVEDVATGANFGTRLDYHKRNRYPGGYSPLVHNASFLSEVRVLRAPSVQPDDR